MWCDTVKGSWPNTVLVLCHILTCSNFSVGLDESADPAIWILLGHESYMPEDKRYRKVPLPYRSTQAAIRSLEGHHTQTFVGSQLDD